MSSMKRLAVMAAFSHFNGHETHKNSTTTMTSLVFLTTTTPMIPSPQTEIAISSFDGANSAYNQNNICSSPQIGGLGLLHQQNLRSGTINNGGSGGVNAFGGYSVGSLSGGAPVMGGGGGSSSSSNGGNPDGSNNINGNVNILLGGAMLLVVLTVLCVVCYCCHRNIKKRTEAAYRQRWIENDTNMEVYSVEQCYETSGLFMESSEGFALPTLTHEPPPSYDAVMVAMQVTSNHPHQPNRISPPPDYRSMNDVSGSSGNASENPKFITMTTTTTSTTSGGNANSLRIKKVLNAQSCCSLQRAEAENLFQLGVAAAAATSGLRFGASALGRKSLPYNAAAAVNGHNLAEGRFINHQPYYQGCPLCGKFRYDDSMSLSSDSGLDQAVVTVDVNNTNNMPPVMVGVDSDTCYCTPLQGPTIAVDDSNNNITDSSMQHATVVDDRRRISARQQLMTSSASSQSLHANYENTINNNDIVGDNETPTTAGDDGTTATGITPSSLLSPASVAQPTATVAASTSNDNHPGESTDDVMLDLDSINDNGIIRLDMSKIIDKTGLPTYEAALKLESSGYV